MKTLQHRLLSFFFAVLLLFAIVVLLVAFLSLRQSNNKYVQSNTIGWCTSIKYNLDQQILLMNRCSLDTIYSTQNMSELEFIRNESFEEVSNLHFNQVLNVYNNLFNIMGSDMKVNQINLYLDNGVCIGNGYNTHFTKYDYKTLPYYQDILKYQGSKLMVTQNGSEIYDDYIFLVRSFSNAWGDDMGIIEIAQSKHRFFEYVSQLTSAQDQIEVYVFDQNTGDLIYPYDPDEISELGESYIQSYYDIFQDVPALENVSVSNPENQNRYILMHDQLDTYGWEVVVVQPEIFVTTPFYKEVIKFLCIFLGILLFLTFAYGRMAKQILKPLNILKSNVERVNMDSILSDNNFLIPNKRIKTQEVATLNCAFEKMYTDLRNSAANMLLMKQRENEANYRALHALADPHFIFNSLATISVMAEENRNEDLIKMTNNLCQILRYSTSRQKGNVTIREEVFIVNKYLECIKIRYGKDLEYNINIPDSIMNISIPKLSIQMLVENCIKHGFEVEPPFQVSVLGRVADGKWMLEISDNGIGFSAEVLESFQKKFNAMESDVDMEDLGIGGSGLTNIFTRLKLMDKDSYFNIENRPEGGCRIQFGNVIKGAK